MFAAILLVLFPILTIAGVVVALTKAVHWEKYPPGGGSKIDRKFAWPGWVAAALFGLLTGVVFLASCLTQVSTKAVGVELAFNKPVGYLSNGLHLKAPWETVTELDAAIQTDNHIPGGVAAADDHEKFNCIQVRVARAAVVCANVSIRWRIVESQAGRLYQDYKSFQQIRDSLVTRDLTDAVNKALHDYDVLAVGQDGLSTAPALSTYADTVLKTLQGEIGKQVTVESVIMPLITFDPATQQRIQALQAQITQTRIAQQAEQTALAQAAANRDLAASLSNDPNVLISKCLDLLSESISKTYALPAGFSCFGPANVAITATR